MPRLNYGTLLENIVILESTRLCLDALIPDQSLGFASTFAMPPLTQCWCKPQDEASSPGFSHAYLQWIAGQDSPSHDLRRFWSLCLKNEPNLQVRMFHQQVPNQMFATAGPNGALLASMLAINSGRQINMWINDNDERYSIVRQPPGLATDTLTAAGLLLRAPTAGSVAEVTGLFPGTILDLDNWLTHGPGHSTTVRVGFLDPDNYAEGQAQVSPSDHQRWLRVLAKNSVHVLSAIFSGCQNRGVGNVARNERIASFHRDEVLLYPESLVFEYGNFQTGVKVRWPEASIQQVTGELRRRVASAWRGWRGSSRALTVHLNGLPAQGPFI